MQRMSRGTVAGRVQHRRTREPLPKQQPCHGRIEERRIRRRSRCLRATVARSSSRPMLMSAALPSVPPPSESSTSGTRLETRIAPPSPTLSRHSVAGRATREEPDRGVLSKPYAVQYNSCVKLIQKQSIARQKGHALSQGVAGVVSVEPAANDSKVAKLSHRPKPTGLVDDEGASKPKKFVDFQGARALLREPPQANWENDRDAPGSNEWLRYISLDKKTGDLLRAQIFQAKG
ncbi:MAG: hypothetical protein SGPRY_010550, partial [Prymnesium sp.]